MDISASDYNNLSGNVVDPGKELFKLVDRPQQSTDGQCVLDIGCGDGKLTILLDQHLGGLLPLYGVDIDERMIEFAKQNYSDSIGQNRIQYLVQDIGVPWSQVRPELKALEGKVPVIFSNMALHWIYTNKENVAQNLSKFLTVYGKIYTNVYCFPNKNTEQDIVFSSIFGQIENMPSKEEQHNKWVDSFQKAGLDLILDNFNSNHLQLNVEEFAKISIQMAWPLCQQFLNSDEERESVKKLFETVAPTFVRKFKNESTGKIMCEFKVNYFQFVLEKKL